MCPPEERRPEVVAAGQGQALPQTGKGYSINLKSLASSLIGPAIFLPCTHEFHAACVKGLRKFGVPAVAQFVAESSKGSVSSWQFRRNVR